MINLLIDLPVLGKRHVRQDGESHFMWLDHLGWHDCNPAEDLIIITRIQKDRELASRLRNIANDLEYDPTGPYVDYAVLEEAAARLEELYGR